eukprot:g13178.t1
MHSVKKMQLAFTESNRKKKLEKEELRRSWREVIVRKEAGANNWPQREKVAQAVEREEFADATVTANVVLLRLIVFPRAQQELVIPEKLRDYVQVAPYKDLVEGLSSSTPWHESFVPHSDQGNCWADPAAHYDAQAPSSSSLRDRPQSPTVRLRNFNSFAKACAVLLDQFLTDVLRQAGGEGRPLSVLDLGCGKGGDLKKLMNSGLTHYCGLDVSYASLEVFRARLKDLQSNRAPRHGLLGRSEGLALKEVALIHADAFRECLESTWDRRTSAASLGPGQEALVFWVHYTIRAQGAQMCTAGGFTGGFGKEIWHCTVTAWALLVSLGDLPDGLSLCLPVSGVLGNHVGQCLQTPVQWGLFCRNGSRCKEDSLSSTQCLVFRASVWSARKQPLWN